MGQQTRMAVFALVACAAFAQNGPSSRGETALKSQFVAVQPDVKLEVLDWGGTGRSLVLLAGGGSTAHVFDGLGPKLAAHYHVIGITRRGSGQSSAPQTGYDPRRLGDDVVAVLDALHIADPILVGHSIAGEELSAISTYHPGRAVALIYLDAGNTFALYNPKHGDYTPALAELRDDLSALQKNLYDDALISKTLTDMALFQINLAELRGEVEGATGPSPKASDLASISAYQNYMKGYYGGIVPESEVRQRYRIGEDGRVGEWLGARCLDRTQAGADREDGQQISFGGAFDLWFGIGSRTEMVGKVRQMLHVDEDVKQAALGHAPHHLKVQPLRGFGNDTSAVLKQNRQAIGTHLYRCVLRKLLIDSGGKPRQLPLQIANELVGGRGHPQPIAVFLQPPFALRPQ